MNNPEFPAIGLKQASVKKLMMYIIVHGTEMAIQEFGSTALQDMSIQKVSSVTEFLEYPEADAFIDLSFENDISKTALLRKLKGLIIINSVTYTLTETDRSFVRINAWPGFLESGVIEASCLDENLKKPAESVLIHLNKKAEWLPDDRGFITPRVIGMIINEAYFALAEGVSTKEDIDTAMKLGTAYPYGPFEWGQKIGLKNIARLLNHLSEKNEQYAPAPLLVQEALTAND